MPKTKRTHLTEITFNKAKKLCDIGLTNPQVIAITGYSNPTVSRIKLAENWAQYREQRDAEYNRQKAKKANKTTVLQPIQFKDAPKEKPVAQTTDTDEIIKDLFTIVQEQSEIIKRMDTSLTWLAEHAVIQSVTTKRRFF
jgi:hypothetical protein